jgi:hypothetical protein
MTLQNMRNNPQKSRRLKGMKEKLIRNILHGLTVLEFKAKQETDRANREAERATGPCRCGGGKSGSRRRA